MKIVDKNGKEISSESSKRIVAGILGIHKFVLGYTKEGFIQIVITIITCGIAGLIGKIEGIIYLTKSDEQFIREYQVDKKNWF